MKKIIVCMVFLFISISSVDARWYGNHARYFDTSPNKQSCNNDIDGTGGGHPTYGHHAVANNNSSSSLTPENSRYNIGASGYMRCLYWDAAVPESLSATPSKTGWTNSPVTITVKGKDRGGSKLKLMVLQQSQNGAGFINVASWNNLNAHNTIVTRTWTRNPVDGSDFKYRVVAYDYAGNSAASAWSDEIKFDTIPPNVSHIGDTFPTSGSNLLATDFQNISVTVSSAGGSPITQIRAYFEDDETTNSYITSPYTSNTGTLSDNYDIRNVDGNRKTNGSREYSFKITKICDEAGNCTEAGNNSSNSVGIKNFKYNVYANTLNIGTKTFTHSLDNISNIADGTTINSSIVLKDVFENIIIPAGGIDRTIDFNVEANNFLRLDQYKNVVSDSGLFVNATNKPIPINLPPNDPASVEIIEQIPTTLSEGKYTLPFYIFAPTKNTDSLVEGSATIEKVSFDVNGTLGYTQDITLIDSEGIEIFARPLFKTTIGGEIKQQGFIEGAQQNSQINIAKLNSTSVSYPSLRLEFGDVDSGGLNVANDRYAMSTNGIDLDNEGHQDSWLDISESVQNLSGMPISTLMTQDGPVENETFSYFATIVKYEVSGKTIVYPSDIIGKDSYHGTKGENNSYQEGIKITGNTSSQNTQELTTGQFTDDIRVIGKLTKSTFRKDIEKKVYGVIRNIDSTSNSTVSSLSGDIWSTTNNKTVLFGGAVRYIKDPSDPVRISGTVSGNKTLVVENGDVYINENITGDGMLGIIVINGDILIDTTVTDIHAILYTNRSILSAITTTDDVDRLDGTASAETLKNQLYIYGSLFSENTIGGSRKASPECPYYVNTSCTQSEAQAYDLNYLRRYYRFGPDSDLDGIPDSKSGEQSYGGTLIRGGNGNIENFPIIIDYNPAIQQTPPPFFD